MAGQGHIPGHCSSYVLTEKATLRPNLVVNHMCFLRVDLHTQQADEPELDPSERERSDRLRVAAKKFFVNFNLSIWVICAKLAPIMLPVIRFLACRFPDKVLVQCSTRIAMITLYFQWKVINIWATTAVWLCNGNVSLCRQR